MVCLPYIIALSRVHWTIFSYNLSIHVVFLFQSFLVLNAISVFLYFCITGFSCIGLLVRLILYCMVGCVALGISLLWFVFTFC